VAWERLINGQWVAEWSGCGISQGIKYRRAIIAQDWLSDGSSYWLGIGGINGFAVVPVC
jgi:hypothetical protein